MIWKASSAGLLVLCFCLGALLVDLKTAPPVDPVMPDDFVLTVAAEKQWKLETIRITQSRELAITDPQAWMASMAARTARVTLLPFNSSAAALLPVTLQSDQEFLNTPYPGQIDQQSLLPWVVSYAGAVFVAEAGFRARGDTSMAQQVKTHAEQLHFDKMKTD